MHRIPRGHLMNEANLILTTILSSDTLDGNCLWRHTAPCRCTRDRLTTLLWSNQRRYPSSQT